tara:strand:+ start:6563 stop:6961 length:399 start_codon:yes stop_codon:yes gene_type:complete
MPKKINPTHIGRCGELFVKHHILQNYPDYNIYEPMIDAGVDLIIERRKKEFLRVQIKTITDMKTDTAVEVRLHKYVKKDLIDVVAVYYVKKGWICFVPYNNESSINLALKPSKNNQTKNRRFFYQYMEFPYE